MLDAPTWVRMLGPLPRGLPVLMAWELLSAAERAIS
ncbi:hypothetical protein HUW46_04371 [Amycolatopsis sp. CA-230715]|nr:hypothetical protein HUW46_04371 [Amycolatopsis sp. CA-230715]